MALILLIVIGAIMGWLATIIARVENRREVMTRIALGVGSAVVSGAIANHGSLLGGLNEKALLLAVVVSVGVLTAHEFVAGVRSTT